MEYRILGDFQVWSGGHEVALGAQKQRALLALLVLRANELVSVDRLIDELWDERPPASAAKVVQVYVSQLRKALGSAGREAIVTRPTGYVVQLEHERLDAYRFERLLADSRKERAAGRPAEAAAMLEEALGLWRGRALADFAYEPFAQAAIARLEELRLVAIEEQVDAGLALGRHADLVGELEGLVGDHPLRERFRAQLMLALYRSGRQAEALEAYQVARRALVDELGIDPGRSLQDLEKAILHQDAALDLAQASPRAVRATDSEQEAPNRTILVVPRADGSLGPLVALAEPMTKGKLQRELLLARIVPSQSPDLARETAELRACNEALLARDVVARVAAFTSEQPGDDIVRLASQQEVDLLLLGTELTDGDEELTTELGVVLAEAPCDVGLVVLGDDKNVLPAADRPVLVPFGAAEHDWAALELGAWFAVAHQAPLELLGVAGNQDGERRDASRLLADASLIVQRLAGIVAEPVVVPPGPEGVLAECGRAGLLVVGLSDRWRQEGLGPARLALARNAVAPTVLVRRSLRPGGLAPPGQLTRFTWSVGGARS